MTGSLEALDQFEDRQRLFDLVRRERFARDQQLFDVMAECFHENAWIRTTWYDAVGGQAYVDATRRNMSTSRGSKHWVFPAFARVRGDRATIESPANILSRRMLGGIQADVHGYCRFFSRAVRQDGQWRLLTFHILFEWDELHPVIAGQVPDLDHELLASIRSSYRFRGYARVASGKQLDPDLLGDDRWDDLLAFHKRENEWLAGAGALDDPR